MSRISGVRGRNGRGRDEGKGLLWNLPVANIKEIGKIGPGFGIGGGCGVGFGVGLFGGTGFGAGFPGLQIGFGVGAGCGVGIGFGYGVGRGVAYDENQKHSNIGTFFRDVGSLPAGTGTQLSDLIEEVAFYAETQALHARKQLVENARMLEKKLENWRRY